MNWFTRFSEWVTVRSLSWAMKTSLSATEVREIFDQKQAHRDEQWRREIWSRAAERAAR